jgi:hypothetical protein
MYVAYILSARPHAAVKPALERSLPQHGILHPEDAADDEEGVTSATTCRRGGTEPANVCWCRAPARN